MVYVSIANSIADSFSRDLYQIPDIRETRFRGKLLQFSLNIYWFDSSLNIIYTSECITTPSYSQ